MSASLVGSEMCIRDSIFSRAALGTLELQAGMSLGSLAGDPPGRTVAVSYTHLTLPTICSV
eukprot:2031063-Alexandrium_andersonii.AAC.1